MGENRQRSEERKKACTEEGCKGVEGTEKGTEFRINKREEKRRGGDVRGEIV